MPPKDEAPAQWVRDIEREANLARAAGFRTYLTGGGAPPAVARNLDILCYPRLYDGKQNPVRHAWCASNDVAYWYYEGGAYTSQDGKVFPNRFFAGFQLVKSGAACHMP